MKYYYLAANVELVVTICFFFLSSLGRCTLCRQIRVETAHRRFHWTFQCVPYATKCAHAAAAVAATMWKRTIERRWTKKKRKKARRTVTRIGEGELVAAHQPTVGTFSLYQVLKTIGYGSTLLGHFTLFNVKSSEIRVKSQQNEIISRARSAFHSKCERKKEQNFIYRFVGEKKERKWEIKFPTINQRI